MKEKLSLSITPSLMIEFLYCPRYIYYMEVLGISQEEGERFKVEKGRKVHEYKSLTNKDYLRKKINVEKKMIDEELFLDEDMIHGKIDEILFLKNGKVSVLDYKYAEYKDIVFETYKMQLVMYSLMVKKLYRKEVEMCYLVFTRSNNKIIEVPILGEDLKKIEKYIEEIKKIVCKNYFPKGTKEKLKCLDCCYKNLCE